MFSVDILISTSKKMLTPTEDMSNSAWPMLLTWSFLVLFDNLGFFCPIVELWPVLNPPNVVVDVTFGLIYLVTFQKVYLKPAAFVRYQILILHWYHLDPPAECPGRQEPCQLSTLHVSGSGTWHSSSLGHVSVHWPAGGTGHLVEAAEEVPDLHPPLAVRVEVESEPGPLPLLELLPLLAGAGTVTSQLSCRRNNIANASHFWRFESFFLHFTRPIFLTHLR